jgi:hypothetical protein
MIENQYLHQAMWANFSNDRSIPNGEQWLQPLRFESAKEWVEGENFFFGRAGRI